MRKSTSQNSKSTGIWLVDHRQVRALLLVVTKRSNKVHDVGVILVLYDTMFHMLNDSKIEQSLAVFLFRSESPS